MCKSVNILVFWSYQVCAGALNDSTSDTKISFQTNCFMLRNFSRAQSSRYHSKPHGNAWTWSVLLIYAISSQTAIIAHSKVFWKIWLIQSNIGQILLVQINTNKNVPFMSSFLCMKINLNVKIRFAGAENLQSGQTNCIDKGVYTDK